MPKPEIIGSQRSTYTRVVRMVCEEKGIDHVLTERLLGAPEIAAIHPLGKMPVLRHGEVELFESKAIATYLDRRFPGPSVFPSDPHLAALTEQWVSFVNTSVDRTLIRTYLFAYIVPKGPDGTPDRAAIEAVMPDVRKQLGILDRAVAATGYLVGGEFSFADINLLPILFYIRRTPEGGEAFAGAPHLSAYYDAHAARPCFARTVPPIGPPRRTTPN
ncbi:MAG TPA: glutathione S-transferase family protein [Bradyrhizobium sp.]|jgi:glutathione S-transferase|uniref:glutathione S-transferase family protein n=1 Tax=Bradyrhizobium sp. TaxID=376 RepID=UPI002BE7D511|nr:glutathione S-transferase family protein [Bradyrhizobium sp.]HTB03494.1 glutathione S-transferase family protein [Bradyrhizobium sp.]